MSLEVLTPEDLMPNDSQESLNLFKDRDELICALIEQQVSISPEALYGIIRTDFVPAEYPQGEIVGKNIEELVPDFSDRNISFDEILDMGYENHLSPLPQQSALYYPLQNGILPSPGQKLLFISHERVYDMYGEGSIFELGIDEGGVWEIGTRQEGIIKSSDIVVFQSSSNL